MGKRRLPPNTAWLKRLSWLQYKVVAMWTIEKTTSSYRVTHEQK